MDVAAVHQIRIRRNEIGHQVVQVAPGEPSEAIPMVHRQLEAWSLVGEAPAYEFFFERGAMRALTAPEQETRPDDDYAVDYQVGVKRGSRIVLAYRWTELSGP